METDIFKRAKNYSNIDLSILADDNYPCSGIINNETVYRYLGYIRGAAEQQTFDVDKGVEWLRSNLCHVRMLDGIDIDYMVYKYKQNDIEKIIEDFIKAMK